MSNKALILLILIALSIGLGLNMVRDKEVEAHQLSLETTVALPSPKALTDIPKAIKNISQKAPGSWQIVFLGYTSCKDICPMTMMELSRMIPGLNEHASANVMLISADPERDDQKKADQYATHFNPSFKAVVLEENQLQTLIQQLGLSYKKIPDVKVGNDIEHSAALAILNPNLELVALVRPESFENNMVSFNEEAVIKDFSQLVNFYR